MMTTPHDPITSSDLASLSPFELAARAGQETDNYRNKQPSDDRYAMELFRRAIVHRDDDAWTCLYRQYEPLVLSWITQHQSATAMLACDDGVTPLINGAFTKFWQALAPAKMADFPGLASLLKYLKMCVHSVVTDETRARQAHVLEECWERFLETDELEEPPSDADLADLVISQSSCQEFWSIIDAVLSAEEERLLVHLTYYCGLRPSDISSRYSQFFPTAEDVYRIKRNVLERLRRNQRLQALEQAA